MQPIVCLFHRKRSAQRLLFSEPQRLNAKREQRRSFKNLQFQGPPLASVPVRLKGLAASSLSAQIVSLKAPWVGQCTSTWAEAIFNFYGGLANLRVTPVCDSRQLYGRIKVLHSPEHTDYFKGRQRYVVQLAFEFAHLPRIQPLPSVVRFDNSPLVWQTISSHPCNYTFHRNPFLTSF